MYIDKIILPFIALLKGINENAHVYYFHDPEFIPEGIFLKLIGKKVIFDIHEYYSEVIPSRLGVKRTFGFIKLVSNLLFERIPFYFYDLLVFPTTSIEHKIGIPSKSITLINLPKIQDIKK